MASLRALAVTVSNRAAAGVYEDRSGPVLAELLRSAGCAVDGPVVVPDGSAVEAALRDAVLQSYDVVVTTGGTGLTPLDLTPEMTRRVIEREIPGIAEALRAAGAAAGVPAAILSRGVAGVAGRTLVVNLPGSTGGVRDGMAVLGPVLGHLRRYSGMMGLWDACAAGQSPSPSLTCSGSRSSCARCG
jgi:molybdenum cofactor synthesis domain-containing protein